MLQLATARTMSGATQRTDRIAGHIAGGHGNQILAAPEHEAVGAVDH
jgi:hypothetical protein